MRLMKKQFIIVISMLLLLTGAASAASAPAADAGSSLAYDIYLKLDGIPGDSSARNYENWIVLSAIEFDVANTAPLASGSGSGAGKAVLNQFSVTKMIDSSSTSLFLATVSGKSIKSGQLVFVTRSDSPVPILTIDLGTILLTSYNFNNAYETVMLNFDSIKLSYSPMKANGGKSTPSSSGWSFFQNKKL